MEQSLFIQWVNKYYPALVLRTVETLNEKNKTALTYLFKQLLRKEYSVDGRWSTLTGAYTRVAADVVAMDSSLPLKTRDALEKASGEIAKMGMELQLTEKQMSDIDAMIAQQMPEAQIVAKVLADVPRVIEGIFEQLELQFLQGLSTGIALTGSGNVGTGIRVNYGYLTANQFGVSALWSTPATSVVVDDINRVLVKALQGDGNKITHAYGNTATFNALIASKQFKEQFAFSQGFVGSAIPTPTPDQASKVFKDLWGFDYTKVDRIIKTEKDGVKTNNTPWKDGTIVFTCDDQVGSVVWTRLAEANRPAKNVSYQTADEYILVSKYHTVRPSFAEFTTSQARVVPIVTNVDRIYTLDTKTVQA